MTRINAAAMPEMIFTQPIGKKEGEAQEYAAPNASKAGKKPRAAPANSNIEM